MNKSIIILILMTFGISLFSQEKSTSRFSFEPIIGAGLSLARLKAQNFLEQGNRPAPATIGIDKELLLIGGAYIKYRLSPDVQLKTGLLFNKEKFDFTIEGVVFGSDIDPNVGYISTSTIEAKLSLHRFYFPLLSDFYLKKDSYHLVAGLAGVFSRRNTYETKVIRYGNGKIRYGTGTDTRKISDKSLVGILGFGRKFCFKEPHPALLVKVLTHYFFKPDYFKFHDKRGNNFIFSLEVGYEF